MPLLIVPEPKQLVYAHSHSGVINLVCITVLNALVQFGRGTGGPTAHDYGFYFMCAGVERCPARLIVMFE